MWRRRMAIVVALVLLVFVAEWPPPVEVTLVGHRGFVTKLAVTELDGRKVVVSMSDDDTVRLWDAAGREEIRRLAVGPENVVIQTMAVADVDGRQVAVVGSSDQSLRLWDLRTGEETFLSKPVEGGYFFRFEDMVIATVDDRTVAVTTGDMEGIEFWDLGAGTRMRGSAPLTEYQQITVRMLDGRLVAVAADGSGQHAVRIPEGDYPERLFPDAVRSRYTERSTGIAEIDGRPVIMVSGGDTVTFWQEDADRGEWVEADREIEWPDASITDLAVTDVDGRPTMILAADKGVAAWDLAGGEQVSDPVLAGGKARYMAVTEMDGAVVVVAGSPDGTIYLQPLDL
ncbi:hypothetical protein E1292_36900 [Nonomuraea deserti]|uniref:Uncharacterized protein n=1 Tax=Nonomuraea deserti TaxID=1848322 RepID=A0A4R4UZ21_9ACTN|nr:hypothetical protein [Nonomuraea deserti]TDC97551.1 hypothetical protein E1292_36900 [Nonomuraea deserti]